jgi:2-amino-4-hydroxy-6-hydroxymethyldihydropteridine diphosphokinase
MTRLLRIELEHGRDRSVSVPKGPRTLDLDLLSYDDAVMETISLTLPHPALAERLFVLIPLAEIAPEWMHPVRRKTAAQLLTELSHLQADTSQAVRRIERHASAKN